MKELKQFFEEVWNNLTTIGGVYYGRH